MRVAVATAFAGLMLTGWYAIQDPTGPSGSAFVMFLALAGAMGILLLVTPINLVRWATVTGRGFGIKLLLVAAAVGLVGLIWTLVVWATDPNYPERLTRGRVLYLAHSAGICLLNYAAIRRVRPVAIR
ncbi:MAG: hypothetical protein EXR94_09500 [Gemmatimonadetes bacterium]|nr:hypothetical protein [Gemmatimonadota bacterium]